MDLAKRINNSANAPGWPCVCIKLNERLMVSPLISITLNWLFFSLGDNGVYRYQSQAITID